jgi:ribosomal protein S18 acetylase RimI-like enzyme
VAAASDGQIVGYIEVWDIEPLPVSNWVWGRVHPDFEDLGIGTGLMDWVDERLKSTVARVPDDLRVCYRSGSLSSHKPTKTFLDNRGMQVVRHFWRMVIDLDEVPPKPTWPVGITVKTMAELKDLRSVYRAFNDAFRDHWGHVEQPEEEMLEEWQHWIATDEHVDPNIWYIAMDGNDIAGVCICNRQSNEDAEKGHVNILGVRRPWRKLGLGLALLHLAFGEFHRRGKKQVGLGVDAANLSGATRLYEKAGMHIEREFHAYEKEVRPGRDISNQG